MSASETAQHNHASGLKLEPIPFPVYFVHPNREKWGDLFDAVELPDPELIYSRFSDSNDIWVVKTYLRLRSRGSMSDSCRNWSRCSQCRHEYRSAESGDCLSIVMWSLAERTPSAPTICNHTIVQNPHNVLSQPITSSSIGRSQV